MVIIVAVAVVGAVSGSILLVLVLFFKGVQFKSGPEEETFEYVCGVMV